MKFHVMSIFLCFMQAMILLFSALLLEQPIINYNNIPIFFVVALSLYLFLIALYTINKT